MPWGLTSHLEIVNSKEKAEPSPDGCLLKSRIFVTPCNSEVFLVVSEISSGQRSQEEKIIFFKDIPSAQSAVVLIIKI